MMSVWGVRIDREVWNQVRAATHTAINDAFPWGRFARAGLGDDCPWIWLHVEKFVIAYSSKIKGLVVTSTELFYPTYCTME